ncbi:MAG: DEAD/DEAH box helicase [Planctomycetota bacterium]|nr:DEAD/DEAH box helicase [Planctomycetota bacterium]MDA1262897.1 DEAD/DEAH box helicase [Planctomycetota bacterium]
MKETFADLGMGKELLSQLTALGYEEPTPIQKAAIAPLMEGRDLLGQAATGTGKTAAFALPILQRIGRTKAVANKPFALVLVPTRELAVQVSEAFHKYSKGLGTSVVPIYGGQEFRRQIVALDRGAHIIVATPGRALDHLRRETLDLSGLQTLVLDEADEMLDMGFAEDLELIMEATPKVRQTALFSATLPPRIASIAERHLKNPARILIPRDKSTKGSMPKVRQTAYLVPRSHKIAALGRVLDLESPKLALIFCRTRIEVDELADRLVGRGYRVEALHGGMSQVERDRVMKKARGAMVDLVVATDVAARGIDIEHVTHVVNFDVPASPESYVHRIGRTGRAGREGVAITLAEPRELRLLRNIESMTKQKIGVSTVPTPLDVKARRLDITKGSIREILLAGELEGFRVVVETLAAEFDPLEIAAAAVRMAHEATAGESANEDDVHIPAIESFSRPQSSAHGGPRKDFAPRAFEGKGTGKKPRTWQKESGPPGSGARGGSGGNNSKSGVAAGNSDRSRESNPRDMVRIFISGGTRMGIRPADIVGAIANEAQVNPRGIGDIEIAEAFSIVELPEGDVDHVIEALRGATLRGRKVKVHRDKGIRS